jgi:CTP:molybdopterin cytidylyltransferase MocA
MKGDFSVPGVAAEKRERHVAAVVTAGGSACTPTPAKGAKKNEAWIAELLQAYERAGVDEVVVMGRGIAPRAGCHGRNSPHVAPCPMDDILSVLRQGLSALSGREDAFFLHPEDRPLLRPFTLKALFSALEDGIDIVRPVFMGSAGFPCLLRGATLRSALSRGRAETSHSLESFVDMAGENGANVRLLECADEGVLRRPACAEDAAYAEDAAWADERSMRPDLMSEAECEALVTRVHGESSGVWAHCRAVSRMAVRLGDALNENATKMDTDLLRVAGLIHDMVRSLPEHGPAAGRLLKAMGFPALAKAVGPHQNYPVQAGSPISEGEVLYLADKLMQGTRCVPVEQRFADKLARYGDTPENRARMEPRISQALLIKERFESASGRRVEELFWQD